MTLADLSAAEFDVSSLNHAEAVLVGDFDAPLTELCEVLVDTHILDIEMIEASTGEFTDEWSRVFVGDKFGMATTHWKKLQERVHRGVGNPCPLLLVGIPSRVVRKAHPP